MRLRAIMALVSAIAVIGCGSDEDTVKAGAVGGSKDAKPSMTVSVGAKGARVDGSDVDRSRLQGLLSAKMRTERDKPIGIAVDPKTPYEVVARVVDQTIIVGAERVLFSMGEDKAMVTRPVAKHERTPQKPLLMVFEDKVWIQLAGEKLAEWPMSSGAFDSAALTARIENLPAQARKSMTIVVEPKVLFEPVMAALVAAKPIETISFGHLGKKPETAPKKKASSSDAGPATDATSAPPTP